MQRVIIETHLPLLHFPSPCIVLLLIYHVKRYYKESSDHCGDSAEDSTQNAGVLQNLNLKVVVLLSLLCHIVVRRKLENLGRCETETENGSTSKEGSGSVLLLDVPDDCEDGGRDRDGGLSLLEKTDGPHGVHKQDGRDIENCAVKVVLLEVDF